MFEKAYYHNGKLREEYRNNNSNDEKLSSGCLVDYYENGNISDSITFFNGNDWMEKRYYEQGAVKEEINYIDKAKFGENFLYYRDGKIKEFCFRDLDGIVYSRQIDSLGNITHEIGAPIAPLIQKTKLSINDTLNFWIAVGLLDNWDIDLSVVDITKGKNDIIKSINDTGQLKKEYFAKSLRIHHLCTKKGVYRWCVNLKIQDKQYHKEINFTDSLTFTVR